jgi:hypothetical protein
VGPEDQFCVELGSFWALGKTLRASDCWKILPQAERRPNSILNSSSGVTIWPWIGLEVSFDLHGCL